MFCKVSFQRPDCAEDVIVCSRIKFDLRLALWSLFWFVGFYFLANQWQVSKEEENPLNEGADAARATIVFSFFSFFTWVLQCLLAIHRFKLGADSVTFNQEYVDPNQQEALQEALPTEE
ncbi:hypothetical protein PFLUV_G00185060 [Perca fluviatilis]|uniref:MARVEL domain-containing protein n=1 Tax=Perca fluviatilis TaxID=8168 RepID=A0A6A5DXF8_PERFL|nr:hypothetical protein PFLUV_G00185060 [Perca fluviatilis]